MLCRPRMIALCALPLVVAGGCKNEDPAPDSADTKAADIAGDEAGKAENPKPPTDTSASAGTPVTGLGVSTAATIQAATAAAAAAPLLEHEGVLGHFMMGNAVASVKEIKAQAAPSSVENMVDLEGLKSLAAMQLGERSTVAINVDLTKPFGCALVNSTVDDAPVACVVGYTGGAEGLVKDLGKADKLDDAKGHLAAYELEGQKVYIDALGDEVALSNHPDVLATAKGYLEANIVNRADKAIADFELVLYPAEAMVRYGKEVEDLMGGLDELSQIGGSPSPTSPADLKKRVAEMGQFSLGLGMTPAGAHLSFDTHAKPGSELQTELDTTYAGRMQVDFVSKLPMSAFAFMGMQIGRSIQENDSWGKTLDFVSTGLGKEFDVDAGKLKAEFEAFVKEESELYSSDIAMGMLYEPGSLGALVLEIGKAAPGRDLWKAWSERFTTEAVLPKKAQDGVQWTFEAGATTIEGIEIDRWSIGPTPDVLKEASADDDAERLMKLWPDLTMHIDRAEIDDRVIFVAAPTQGDSYMQAAIKATRDGKSVKDRKGWKGLDSGRSELVALYAFDVAGGIEWLRPILPPSDAADIPSPLGVGIDDVTIVVRHPAPGVVSGSFNVSQSFIDQLKLLADR
ncbi:MAG: hypothetical protein KUG77_18355 [Nannocystaceae bacterium]|nr:hypothetical protein [Nannocystaceae bacterium]